MHPNVLRVVDAVAMYTASHGYSPSLRDVAAMVGLSVSATYAHLATAESAGLLLWEPGVARSYRIPPKVQTA